MPVPESKTCSKCGELKPLDEFPKNGRGGRRAGCKACHAAYVKARYHADPEAARRLNNKHQSRRRAANPEQHREKSRQWREANREKHIAMSVAWAQANPEKVREYKRRYDAANPDKKADAVRRRRVRLAGVESRPYTRREIYERDGGKCRHCGLALPFAPYGYEIDHIVPIILGGPDTPANVELTCRACNRTKAASLKGQLRFAT